MDKSQEILSSLVIFNKYAKHVAELNRREMWEEICERNMVMQMEKYPQIKNEIKSLYEDYVMTKKVLPSMRSMQFAGAPIELSNSRVFNCAYVPMDHPFAFAEMLFLLLGGCFEGDTLVKTSLGDKKIKDITTSDFVLTYSEKTKEFSWVNPKIAGKTLSAKKPKVKVTMANGEFVICTEDHKFLTNNRGWVEAVNLTPSDDIISSK